MSDAMITSIATVLAALIAALSAIVVAKINSSQGKEKLNEPGESNRHSTPMSTRQTSKQVDFVQVDDKISHKSPPLILILLVAAFGWMMADVITEYAILPLPGLGSSIILLINRALFGAATGLILWWSMPAIRWKGSSVIFLGWVIAGIFYGWLINALNINLNYLDWDWFLVRSISSIFIGAVTGWGILMHKRPFQTVFVFMIAMGWWFARSMGILLALQLLEFDSPFAWYAGEALSGALGIWITIAVAKQSE
jgi:hypothetical protein